MDGFKRVISLFESKAELAKKLGVHPMSISHWEKRGVPAARILDISEATGWVVSPHELAPHIYPYPDDGLPQERRQVLAERDGEAAA